MKQSFDNMGPIVSQMVTDQMRTLEPQIKTRVTPETKETLEGIAAARQLSLSDVIREAVREFLDKQKSKKASPARR